MPTSADELTSQEEQQALQNIQDNNIRQTSTKTYIEDVKNSQLFRPDFNWGDLLPAAPVSVSLLGSLFVASTVPDATNITIIPPTGGFEYLRNFDSNPSLSACLVQCADKGAETFGTASTSFDAISLNTSTIKQTVNLIIKLLANAESAEKLLVPTIKTLARVAKECEKTAQAMEQTFQHWLKMICELHACVVQTSTKGSEKRNANQAHLATAKARLASAEKIKRLAKKSVDTLHNSLNTATSAYSKAADEFPSGWDLVAQQFVSDLSDSLTNTFNLAVPALIENFSIATQMQAGISIFNGDNGGATGGSLGDGKADHSTATQVPPPTPRATLPYPNDPTYGIIGLVRNCVETIRSFVTGGPDQGVDWENLTSKDKAKQNNGVGVMALLLKDEQQNFKPSLDPPSKDLEAVLEKAKTVTDGLQYSIEQNNSLNGALLPGADSEEVKQWQLNMRVSVAKAVQLDTGSKNLATASSPPLINSIQATSAPTEKKGALRKQVIDAATTKLQTTAKVMETVSEQYQQSSSKLVDFQEKIGQIQAELAGLDTAKINLICRLTLSIRSVH